MLWCHWSIAIYESSTRANISHLSPNSFLWGLYGDRPIDFASGVLAVFFRHGRPCRSDIEMINGRNVNCV